MVLLKGRVQEAIRETRSEKVVQLFFPYGQVKELHTSETQSLQVLKETRYLVIPISQHSYKLTIL